jgi:hypothetical protein
LIHTRSPDGAIARSQRSIAKSGIALACPALRRRIALRAIRRLHAGYEREPIT